MESVMQFLSFDIEPDFGLKWSHRGYINGGKSSDREISVDKL